ncbi:PIR Superfamily Protein, partial [Plasmodium ovale curtisi]
MSPDTEYFEFWNSIKDNNFTKNETLGDIYAKLEKMCSEDKNKNYCIIDSDQYNDCDNVKKLHHNLYGNRIKYESTDNEFTTLYNYPIKFCNYLKYWLYDKIIFNMFDESEITKVLVGLEKGDKIQLVMGNSYRCIFDILILEKIKMIKLFYDYLGNYDVTQKKSSINDKICNSKYKTTLNNMISLYNDRNTYCANQSNEYCNEFKEYKEIYMVKKLCKLQCNNEGYHILEEALSVCSEADSLSQHSSKQDSPGGKLDRYTTPVRGENNSVEITMTVIPTPLT